MASPSIREIGTEQAQEGTSIDGNRLSAMVRSLLTSWNSLKPRHVERRWVPVTFCGGYTPQQSSSGTQDNLPWLGGYNSAKQRVLTAPDLGYQNPWRSKGNAVSGINPQDPATGSLDDLLTWSTSLYFRNPARLSGVMVALVVDTSYHNTFTYGPGGGNIPPGKSSGGSSDDWTVTVEVDDPFAPEERRLSSVIYCRRGVAASAWQWSNLAPGAPTTDMLPAHPGGNLCDATSNDSLVLLDMNLDVPIPQDSRVRLNITIPRYEEVAAKTDDYDAGWWNDGVLTYNPWQAQSYSWSLHFMEALAP